VPPSPHGESQSPSFYENTAPKKIILSASAALTGFGKTQTSELLVDAILNPSSGISHAYLKTI